jgi:hypothetical protein
MPIDVARAQAQPAPVTRSPAPELKVGGLEESVLELDVQPFRDDSGALDKPCHGGGSIPASRDEGGIVVSEGGFEQNFAAHAASGRGRSEA